LSSGRIEVDASMDAAILIVALIDGASAVDSWTHLWRQTREAPLA
jgi:hypothetical protein